MTSITSQILLIQIKKPSSKLNDLSHSIVIIKMSKTSLHITCRTWISDSSLLFDYKSNNFYEESLNIPNTGHLALCSSSDSTNLDANLTDQIVLKINKSGDDYIISPVKQHPVGEVIGKTKRNSELGTLVTEGDIFKLGRIFFKIKELCNEGMKAEDVEIEKVIQDEKICRICFSNWESDENPLISVCLCSGSMKYTHLVCLQKWVVSKAKIRKSLLSESYKWSSVSCDVCKQDLPLTIHHNGAELEVLCVARPKNSYIILEEIKNEGKCLSLHVVKFDSIPVIIGRSTYSEIRVNDMSISKFHASIEMVNGKCYIKDNNSKFGTILLLYKPILLRESKVEYLQVNNTFLTLKAVSLRGIRECFGLCFKSKDDSTVYPEEIYWKV